MSKIRTVRSGDKFKSESGGTYITCMIDGLYHLVNIETGSTYSNGVSYEEFLGMVSYFSDLKRVPASRKKNELSDEQFDEFIDYLQGMKCTQSEGLEACGFKGMKLTKEQRIFRDENIKKCRRCGTWIGICDTCC